MKFGKGLLQEVVHSNPEWAPFWLNYKSLKKRIKQVKKVASERKRNIEECDMEIAFFRDLQMELKKISLFYSNEEKRCSQRFHQLRAVLLDLKAKSNEKVDANEAQRLMFAFVHFYRECIRLEKFAVMNYQGFSKILKKHDKMTGYDTRTKYMRKKVNLSSFSQYPHLLELLERTEEMFHDVEKDARMASAMSMVQLQGTKSTPTQGSIHDINEKAPHTKSSPSSTDTRRSFPASVLWSSDDLEGTKVEANCKWNAVA